MDKLALGRKIAELRITKGYSQEQLGSLLRLSGGAVSKWENGGAIPRRSVCEKLSYYLGYDFNLMIEDNLSPDESDKLVTDQQTVLWKEARRRLLEIYGNNPPLFIANRFMMERDALRYGKYILIYDIAGKVRDAARQKGARFNGSNFCNLTAWLMGASDVNPLEPHARCPKCHRVELHPEVLSGFDLREMFCSDCGTRMINDGQNIPQESYLLGPWEPYDIYHWSTDADFMKEAEEIIVNYGEQFFGIEKFSQPEMETYETDPEGNFVLDPKTKKKIPVHYISWSCLMFRPKKKAKIRKADKITEVKEIENYGKRLGQPVIVLYGAYDGPMYLWKPSPFRASPDELTQQEVLDRALRDYWNYLPALLEERTDTKLPDPAPYFGKLTFAKFVSMMCAANCLYMCSGPEELAEKTGVADLTELPCSAADLWRTIQSRLPYPGYMSGTVSTIVKRVSEGKYLNGITPATRKLFNELNLPEWFETYAENIFLLTSRSEYTQLAILLLEDARRKIREGK